MLLDFFLFSLTLPHTIGTNAVYTFLQTLKTDILGHDRRRLVESPAETVNVVLQRVEGRSQIMLCHLYNVYEL